MESTKNSSCKYCPILSETVTYYEQTVLEIRSDNYLVTSVKQNTDNFEMDFKKCYWKVTCRIVWDTCFKIPQFISNICQNFYQHSQYSSVLYVIYTVSLSPIPCRALNLPMSRDILITFKEFN